jgi:quinoprotein glucose dehydrogenase
MRRLLLCALLVVSLAVFAQAPTGVGWPTYGGDAGGQRYSNAAEINRTNVAKLHPVWTYHTHALENGNPSTARSNFEATPILFEGTMYLSTAFGRVIALDPSTGTERWTYDPALARDGEYPNLTSRGVAAWKGKTDSGPCGTRIFVATLDARLIAVDGADGKVCAGFGVAGTVDLKHGVPTRSEAPYRFFGNTSPATVVGDVVVVGSSVGDNQAIDVEPGYVRGFDARSGNLLWHRLRAYWRAFDGLLWRLPQGRQPRRQLHRRS